jgi:hypothetical protein
MTCGRTDVKWTRNFNAVPWDQKKLSPCTGAHLCNLYSKALHLCLCRKVVDDRKIEETAVGLLQKSLERKHTYTQKLFLALNGLREDWSLRNSFSSWVAATHIHRVGTNPKPLYYTFVLEPQPTATLFYAYALICFSPSYSFIVDTTAATAADYDDATLNYC